MRHFNNFPSLKVGGKVILNKNLGGYLAEPKILIVSKIGKVSFSCEDCPIKWNLSNGSIRGENPSIYHQWVEPYTDEKWDALQAEIAEKKERTEVLNYCQYKIQFRFLSTQTLKAIKEIVEKEVGLQ